MRKKTIKKR